MDGKIATLAGAAALIAAPTVGGATPQSAQPAVPVAASYAELLTPIADAPARLQQADLQDEAAARLIPVQYQGDYRDDRGYRDDNGYRNHHHHHHHNHYSRSWYLNHGYYWFGGRWVLRPVRRDYHHHHHHHHDYRNNY
jgi:hypothetical protein